MMMMSFASIGLISILWLFYGFAFAFGPDELERRSLPNFLGDPQYYWGWKDLTASMAFPPFPATPIPTYVIMAFQMMFAIITVALISGAISDRTKFAGWLVFAAGWFTLAYVPIAHMVWGGGYIGIEHRRARLRRWYGGAHQRRCGGAGAGASCVGRRVG